MEALTTILPGADSTSTRPLFSAGRKLEPEPLNCAECAQEMAYREQVIAPDDGRGNGFYLYRRPLCRCEQDRERLREAEERERERKKHRDTLLQVSNTLVGNRASMTLGNVTIHDGNREAFEAASSWVEDWPQHRGLVFYGPPGVGKTHLAVGIVRAMANWLVWSEVWKAKRLMDVLRPGEEGPRQSLDRFIRMPVLAIDDLGKERLTDWALEQIFDFLDERDLHSRPVIITTNLTSSQLASRIGEAAISRLIGNSEWIEITGGDWRVR